MKMHDRGLMGGTRPRGAEAKSRPGGAARGTEQEGGKGGWVCGLYQCGAGVGTKELLLLCFLAQMRSKDTS